MTRVHVTDEQRRSRLARRQGLAPWARFTDVLTATSAMTAWHSTDAATVHLAAHARVDGLTVADVDQALYVDRSIVKQFAMRQTIWAVDRHLLPALLGSAAPRVAGPLRRTLIREIEAAGLAPVGKIGAGGEMWLARAQSAIVDLIDRDGPVTTAQVRAEIPFLSGKTSRSPGTKWGGDFPIAPRILTLLGAEGVLTRAENAGHWRLSKPSWTTMATWLGDSGGLPEPSSPDEGYAALVRSWLATFGPGTEDDIVWWLGATKTAVRAALLAVEAVDVDLDGGTTGWVLPDDPAVDGRRGREGLGDAGAPWAALLPTLDPSTMGYRGRDFYLDPRHTPYLFDSVGNGGPTAWWNGRIVGAWVQDDTGRVEVLPREPLAKNARDALDLEAERLSVWLDGVQITAVYRKHQVAGRPLP